MAALIDGIEFGSEPAGRTSAVLGTLSANRTVDRVFVHWMAVNEVLLTDARQLGRDHFVAAAQPPKGHAYYGDHVTDGIDPLLLFEACRQAGLYASHVYEGMPQRHKFILTHLEFERHHIDVVEFPCRLLIDAHIVDRRMHDREVSGIDLEMSLAVPGGTVGIVRLGLRFRTPDSYHALRLRNRADREPESTEQFQPAHGLSLVASRKAGRRHRENVIIGDLAATNGAVRGVLRIPAEHASMFDHAQDHIPGMVLAEAVRQLAVCAAGEQHGWTPGRTTVDQIGSVFLRFGELEPSTILQATVGEIQESPQGGAGRVLIAVEINQDGVVICTAWAVLTTTSRHRRRSP